MIEELLIRREASYDDVGQKLGGLKRINFIFGVNGSGKTTISRLIANPSTYTDSNVTWRNGIPIDCFVYNTDFVANNFRSQMAGIFTLGSKDAAISTSITQAKNEIDDLNRDVATRMTTLRGADGNGGKEADLATAKSEFDDQCWTFKTRYDEDFRHAFAGVRGSRIKFSEKLFNEFQSNTSEPHELIDLKRRAELVFREGLERATPIPALEYQELVQLENTPVLARRVIGKEDVDIAALIRKLKNSDWVKEGRKFFEEIDSTCPFCQQKTDAKFAKSLRDYFDETYVREMDAIETLTTNYTTYADSTRRHSPYKIR